MFEDKFKGDLIKKIKKIITNKPDDNWLNWLEEAISKKYIKYYEYESFKNIQIIGQGHFGKVFRVNYKDSEQYFALKSFSNLNALTIKEIVHELKLQREVDYHNNIIRFHGITKNQGQSKNYLLVLEYASDGILRDYLKKIFDDLSWDQKHDLALQIACAVSCLHNENILHCDLHPGNILVHQNIIKLADFGLSKRIEEATNPQSSLHGVVPYIDPKRFENPSYELNEKSDVYSVGVLLWEISSGKPPFHNDKPPDEIALTLSITQGNREEPVSDPDIPSDYVKLYEECWDGEPNNRPNMEQVTSRLRKMLNKNDDNDDQTDDDLLSYIQSDHELPILSNNLPMSSYFSHVPLGELREAIDNQENQEIEIDHNNEQIMIDGIIDFMWKKTNEGRESKLKDHVSNIIKNNFQGILNWLSSNNQNNLNCNFLLGYFHYKGIRMNEDKTKAFELFHNAENQDHDLTLYYLGICYQYGYGTTKNENSAFNCFFKLSQKDIAAGQSRTGHCYAKGIGIKNDKKLAIDYYEKAASNGNLAAKYNLGNCYLVGKLVDKDVKKGFELIQQTAEIEFSLNGITMLGFCYHNGIGTQEDKEAAFKLYKKSANLGDKTAQYNLAQMYEKEDNTMKDIDNAIRWYKKSGYKDSEKRAKKLLKLKYKTSLTFE